jgi:hypothetical protein
MMFFQQGERKRPKKRMKCSAITHSLAYNGNNHFAIPMLNIVIFYLKFPEDMVEYSPMDLDNIKEKQDENNDLHQSLPKHPAWYT